MRIRKEEKSVSKGIFDSFSILRGLVLVVGLMGFVILSMNFVVAQDPPLVVCIEGVDPVDPVDPMNPDCMSQENFAETVKDFKEFQKMDPAFRKRIIETYEDEFAEGFRQASAEDQLSYFIEGDPDPAFFIPTQRPSDQELLIKNDLRAQIFNSLDAGQKSALTQGMGSDMFNEAFGDATFSSGINAGEKPTIMSSDIQLGEGEEVKFEGKKMIFPNGDYINFDSEADDKLSSRITRIDYKDGKLILGVGEISSGSYDESSELREVVLNGVGLTPTKNGLVDNEGNVVGGDKGLDAFYVRNTATSGSRFGSIEVSKNENGDIIFTIDEDRSNADSTFIKTDDINGEPIFHGVNRDSKGTAIVKIEKGNNRIWTSAVETITNGHGSYKTSSKGFTALAGSYFENPNNGLSELESDIKASVMETIKARGGDTAMSVLNTYFDRTEVDADGNIKFKERDESYSAEKKEGYISAIGGLIKEVKTGISEEISGNPIEEFERNGQSYIYLDAAKNMIKSEEATVVNGVKIPEKIVPFNTLKMGGKLPMLADITHFGDGVENSNGLDVLEVNDFPGDKNIINVVNGESILTFKEGGMWKNNKVSRFPSVPVGAIINPNVERVWTWAKDYKGNFGLFPADATRSTFVASKQFIGAGGKPIHEVGGVKVSGASLVSGVYPTNAKAEFFVDPKINSNYRAGPLRKLLSDKGIAPKAGKSFNDLSAELNDQLRLKLTEEVRKRGGVDAFEAKMNDLNRGIRLNGEEEIQANPSKIAGLTQEELDGRNIWNMMRSGEFDSNIRKLASAEFKDSSGDTIDGIGVGRSLVLDRNGAFFNGVDLGLDPRLTGAFASGIAKNPPKNKETLSLIGAYQESKKDPSPIYNLNDAFPKGGLESSSSSSGVSSGVPSSPSCGTGGCSGRTSGGSVCGKGGCTTSAYYGGNQYGGNLRYRQPRRGLFGGGGLFKR
jgi:hypothetical protein